MPAEDKTNTALIPDDGFTEELPPLQIDPRSFDARIAGIEQCSVVGELAKHRCSITAFEIDQEKARRARDGEAPAEDEDKLFRQRWLEVCSRRHPDPAEFIEHIKRKASRFVNWGDIGRPRNAEVCSFLWPACLHTC